MHALVFESDISYLNFTKQQVKFRILFCYQTYHWNLLEVLFSFPYVINFLRPGFLLVSKQIADEGFYSVTLKKTEISMTSAVYSIIKYRGKFTRTVPIFIEITFFLILAFFMSLQDGYFKRVRQTRP